MNYLAMNRFRIVQGHESEFESVWQTRTSYLKEVPGFVSFNLLRGPERENHVLYASHSLWKSEKHFKAWTRSDAFHKAHSGAGKRSHLYHGHPEFEGFTVVEGAGAE